MYNFVHVLSYLHLKKNGLFFTPLRAAGLALEKAHKCARDKGGGNTGLDDVAHVSVSGPSVVALVEGRMRKVKTCRLDVQLAEQTLVLTLLREQRLLFASMFLNLWYVDKSMRGGLGFHDLVGEFSTDSNFGVRGLVSVELKICSPGGLSKKWSDVKTAARTKLASLRETQPAYEAVMVVASFEV